MSRITARPREVLTLLFAFVVTTLLHRFSVANRHAGFRWSYADNFGALARGADCIDVHIARLHRWRPIVEDPELTMRQESWVGQEDQVVV